MDLLYRIATHCNGWLEKIGLHYKPLSHENLVHSFISRLACNIPIDSFNNDSYRENYTIWIFWAQGESQMPETVKQCYTSVLKNRGRFNVVLLDMKNYFNYVDIPDYILKKMKKGVITITHFSDILRFALLEKYGGFWLDATIYVASKVEMPKSLFTVRQRENSNYVSKCRWCGFFWYIPKKHPLPFFVYKFLCVYWYKYNNLVDYFLIDYIIAYVYNHSKNFRNEIDKLPYSNPNIYFFQESECEKVFDGIAWKKICSNTQFFKMTWKKVFLIEKNGLKTFYGKLLTNGIDNNTHL